MPKPRNGVGYTRAEMQGWLDAGLAHITFDGGVILYNGGRSKPLTNEDWLREFAPKGANK
jgi:hypothetical protein